MKKLKRQGDILFEKINKINYDVVKIKDDNVIAEGEATGHCHLLKDGVLYEDVNGSLYVDAKQDAKVVHEEHNTVPLDPGFYLIKRQREYEPNGWRRVSD